MTRQPQGEPQDPKTERLLDATITQEHNVLRELHSAGVTKEQFVAMGNDKAVTQGVAGLLRWVTLFSTPEEQIGRMLMLNEEVWHDPNITKEAIQEIGPPPHCPAPIFTEKEKRFYVRFLFYEFGFEKGNNRRTMPLRTFEKYWEAMKYLFEENNLKRDERDSLCFADGAMDRHREGFSWRVIELYHFSNSKDSQSTRQELFEVSSRHYPRGLGHDVLAIPIMHPRWIMEADVRIPFTRKAEWFGLDPIMVLEMNLVDENGRTSIPVIYNMDGVIHFKGVIGNSTACPAYYKKITPPWYGMGENLPKVD